MEYLRLGIGLLLPWLGGYYWLVAAEKRFDKGRVINPLRQIGYGLFLGYAGLLGIIQASAYLLGRVEYWPVLTAVALLTVIGGLLSRKAAVSPPAARPIESPDSIAVRLLIDVCSGYQLGLVAEFLDHENCCVLINDLINRNHRTHFEKRFYNFVAFYGHALCEISD